MRLSFCIRSLKQRQTLQSELINLEREESQDVY